MSLNTATSGLTGRLPKNDTVDSLTTGDIASSVHQQQQQVSATANNLTGSVLPGGFPEDGNENDSTSTSLFSSITQWIQQLIFTTLDKFESGVKWFICWLFPPPRQAALYDTVLSRPIATTFVICQLICCGVPLLVFLSGLFLFAAVATLLWAVLSFLILGPILLVTSLTGLSLWGWGWIVYGLVKWIDQKYLGGMITRFWLSQAQQAEDGDGSQEEKKET
jgi:hypothetical protein